MHPFLICVSYLLEQSAINEIERQAAAASSALVEAFYGDATSSNNRAIAFVAGEHARAALRIASATSSQQSSLFSWLGITEDAWDDGAAEDPEDSTPSSEDREAVDEVERWEMPFMSAPEFFSGSQGETQTLPLPNALWQLRPPPGFTRPHHFTSGPLTRRVSAVSSFGSLFLEDDVGRWLAASPARQNLLRQLMVSGKMVCRLYQDYFAGCNLLDKNIVRCVCGGFQRFIFLSPPTEGRTSKASENNKAVVGVVLALASNYYEEGARRKVGAATFSAC